MSGPRWDSFSDISDSPCGGLSITVWLPTEQQELVWLSSWRLHPAFVYLPFVVPAAWRCLPGITETGERLSSLLLSPVWKVLGAFSLIPPHEHHRVAWGCTHPQHQGSAMHSVWLYTGKTCWRSQEDTVHVGTVLIHAEPWGICSECRCEDQEWTAFSHGDAIGRIQVTQGIVVQAVGTGLTSEGSKQLCSEPNGFYSIISPR